MGIHDPNPRFHDWPTSRKRRRRHGFLTELGWLLVIYFALLALGIWWAVG